MRNNYLNRKPGASYTVFIFFLFIILSVTSGCYLDDRDNVFDERSNNYYKVDYVAKETAWTFMVFAGADNNLEQDILLDINEMQQGMKNVEGINLIVFIDRSSGFSSDSQILGENFSGGKIFRVTGSKIYELYGGDDILPECRPDNFFDANSGSAVLLQKFIQFSKENYPADKYALVLSSHGGGAAKRSVLPVLEKSTDGSSTRDVSVDDTSGDRIYTAEITDDLTSAESVDLLGYDACLMGSVEVAYQYRPGNGSFSADFMVASPASEWSLGWNYTTIFQRFAGTGVNVNETNDVIEDQGTNEQYFDVSSMTARQFGSVIVEEFYDQFTPYRGNYSAWDQSETMSCYDLSKVAAVKTAVENLVTAIDPDTDETGISGLGISGTTSNVIYYYEYSSYIPYFPFHDLYDFAVAISNDTDEIFSDDLSDKANLLETAVDDMILYSFGGLAYDSMSNVGGAFQNGQHGVHIYFPRDVDFETYGAWYNSIDIENDLVSVSGYGKLAWCIDGQNTGVGVIGNWFELLDYWYDSPTDPDFNNNGYTP